MLSRTDDAKNSTTAFEASEQRLARVLLDTLSHPDVQRQLLTNPKLNDLVTKQLELRRSIFSKFSLRSEAVLKNKTDRVVELDRQIASLSSERSDIESQIRTQYPDYAELMSPRPLAADDNQQQLDPDTQLLEFALGEKRSYAWVVTSDKIQGFELAPRKDIEALATRLLQAITERNRKIPDETSANTKIRWNKADKDYEDAAAALSKLILTPIAPALQRDRLVVVADGALQLVPFALLPDPVASSQLIAKHEIVSLPSASVLALQRQELAHRKPAPMGVAVVADPVFELQDPRIAEAKKAHKNKTPPPVATLPIRPPNETLISALRSVGADDKLYRLVMSRVEAAEIERVVPKNELFEALDFQANRGVVMSGALSKYRYVHFATHGVINLEHPELSGIVFSMVDENGKEQDGYVRLYEIYNLNLPAELVVLSACQTGVGKQIRGEGLMALTRGFMYAGAARIVASLWKVDDSATAALMAQFYKEMFTNGKKPAAALHAAQVYMSQQKPWKSPYYWAGFVLQGEWR
jgi:CHAT domain-containing protein